MVIMGIVFGNDPLTRSSCSI